MTYINIAPTGAQVTRANFPASIDAQPQHAPTGAHGTIFSFAANAINDAKLDCASFPKKEN